jgi:KaiC/GvpD/RAD55 family RecA-like ATPase
MKLMTLDKSIFSRPSHRKLAELMKAYVVKYRTCPTKDALTLFSNDLVKKDKDLDEYSDALLLLNDLPGIEQQEFEFYFEKAENYLVGRNIYDLADSIKTRFEEEYEIDYKEMRRGLLHQLLASGASERHIKRGYVYETVKERWETYKNLAQGNAPDDLIPFGMKALDNVVGGMRRTHLVLFYSRTGGGKTRTSINVAYNAAMAGYNVMLFTLEMEFDLVATCFDSRMAWLNNDQIMYGKLKNKGVKKFKEALKKQVQEELNIWLVDNPSNSTPNFINEEIELYQITTGKKPHLVIIDYAGLMRPNVPYNGRSEKYDFLFHELHESARFYDTAVLTSVIESRERSKADKKKGHDSDEEIGVEGIGLSNYMAPHCEMVIRLKQDKYDAIRQKLMAIIEKHRYGKAFTTVELYALWEKNYVGDDIIPGTKSLVLKDNKN